MRPIDFPWANKTLAPPDGHENWVQAMRCFTDGKSVISRWQLGVGDLSTIARTGGLWLEVFSGSTVHPLLVSARAPSGQLQFVPAGVGAGPDPDDGSCSVWPDPALTAGSVHGCSVEAAVGVARQLLDTYPWLGSVVITRKPADVPRETSVDLNP